MREIYYKYRGLSNLEFALDIFINKRLYAAEFKYLNDPMEGTYIYSEGALDQNQIYSIYQEKISNKICSLSANKNNMLMWSHYADGHRGFVIGIEIVPDENIDVKKVEYVTDLHLDYNSNNYAKSILSKKLKPWKYEEEYRVFTREKYVDIRIKELIFGCKVEENSLIKDLLTKIAKEFNPGITIENISKNEFDARFE